MIGTRKIEIIATLCGLINIILIVRRNIWNYPFGLVMVTLYFFIFKDARLYSDMLLQPYFFVMQLFGWYWWLSKPAGDGKVAVARISTREAFAWIGIAVIGVIAVGTAMSRFTDAALPFWDAATSVGSIIAMYFMARRLLENWVVWILVDVLAIGIYWVKGLQPTSALYLVFLCMASVGLYQWYRSWRSGIAIAK
ncbi:MAG: nicotinamide mononucleotide transporter [Hellea sp.]|nr:nicotinamide mononucleotide transporter [Hellea sp.]